MASQNHNGVWIGRADVEELDIVISRCCEISFIWGNAEAIDLRIGMLDCTVAYARESFPEADCVVVASYGGCQRSAWSLLITCEGPTCAENYAHA